MAGGSRDTGREDGDAGRCLIILRRKKNRLRSPKGKTVKSPANIRLPLWESGKSRFLDQLIDSGKWFRPEICLCTGFSHQKRYRNPDSIKGVESPDRLPNVLEGDFGLVWDGESLEEGQEAAGRYLRYNCPHKFSLYMAAGMPVIVGKQSAMAEITERETLGITVEASGNFRGN